MKKLIKHILSFLLILCIVLGLFHLSQKIIHHHNPNSVTQTSISKEVSQNSSSQSQQTNQLNQNNNICHPQYIEYHNQKVVDWNAPTGNYPDLTNFNANQLLIQVNQQKQLLSIYNKDTHQLLTQFVISTGKSGFETPNGNFKIQSQHGKWFYNSKPNIQEGAYDYVSFYQHGVYLFHSVPCDQNGQPIASRMGKLGHKNSHGCIQLSFPDIKWFYHTFTQPNKIDTQVTIF